MEKWLNSKWPYRLWEGYIILLFLVTPLLLSQCSGKPGVVFPEVVTLPQSVKENATQLKDTQIFSSDEHIAAKNFFVHNDSVLVVLNKPVKDHCFIELFSLSSEENYGQFVHYGNGPKEMLNVQAHFSNGKLVLHDFAKHQITSFDVDSALFDKSYSYRNPIWFNRNAGSPFVTFLNDDTLIMLNPYYFENRDLKISNGEGRFIVGSSPRQFTLYSEGSRKYYSFNVEQGCIIVNSANNRIIFASDGYPRIEIYDCHLNPLKMITGPDKLDIKYHIDGNEIIYSKRIPYAYRYFAEADDGFYLKYHGAFFTGNESFQVMDSWLFKFDWDGNILESYHCDKYLSTFSLSSVPGIFYGDGYDSDGNRVLYKLTTY